MVAIIFSDAMYLACLCDLPRSLNCIYTFKHGTQNKQEIKKNNKREYSTIFITKSERD